ncbi:MAG TPA: sodium-translocating pyrophosphatase [Candidatus Coatesbacteria bacterium]|nr:sodium-translocating pyrophosphatase [Candidatus Coatesbacteria bacterium]
MFLAWPLIGGSLAIVFMVLFAVGVLRKPRGTPKMVAISREIQRGALTFLSREYRTAGLIILLVGGAMAFTGLGWRTAVSFALGAAVSAGAGFIGMAVATRANASTAHAAREGVRPALVVAVSGGAVMGLCVVGLSLLGLALVIWLFAPAIFAGGKVEQAELLRQAGIVNGFAVGASLMALFARSGGGIFTKGADMAADLVGKVEAGIPEDDPRNPAVIADNVGDNVGDTAGMGADLLESYVESVIASMSLAAAVGLSAVNRSLMLLPLAVAATGTVASVLAVFFTRLVGRKNPQAALTGGTYLAAALTAGAAFFLVNWLGTPFDGYSKLGPFWAVLVGIGTGVLIGLTSEYYTSSRYKPVKRLAAASDTNAAVTVTEGLAVGMESLALPVLILAGAVIFAHHVAGMYGVAMAAVGMLATTGMVVSVDSYGPIADNAGGIAQMAGLAPEVRRVTDHLDAVGNTTAAIGKGFAIGSAALAALGLLTAYIASIGTSVEVLLTDPLVLAGLVFGGALPFIFSSQLFRAVVRAADAMIREVRRQFDEIPGLREGAEGVLPQSARCVDIAAKSALAGMVLPGLLAVAVPVLVGFLLGPLALAGVLVGSIVTGVMLGIFAANSGAAMDNAKKYIEEGNFGGKGSRAHKAAVVGDTVGDPLKDTVGPSINILIKLMAVISLVIAPILPGVAG